MNFCIVSIFIALDFITGLIYAIYKKKYSSRKMREGIIHKSSLFLVYALAVSGDYAQTILDIGISIPLTGAVTVYLVVMEAGSILENLCKINPTLKSGKLKKIFSFIKEQEDKEDGN